MRVALEKFSGRILRWVEHEEEKFENFDSYRREQQQPRAEILYPDPDSFQCTVAKREISDAKDCACTQDHHREVLRKRLGLGDDFPRQ